MSIEVSRSERAQPGAETDKAAAEKRPSFSIIIPTYNEAHDIGDTLSRALAQTLAPVDVIVVDGGSVDGTVEVLRRWGTDRRVTVVEEGYRRGVSAARNTGIRLATGDVVVILNADVLLPPDFLERLAALYADDADLVSVDSVVENMDAVTGRYVHAVHRLEYGATAVGWSEGFSCRRDAALKATFPEEIPGAGGEDVEFVERLLRAGYNWKVDYSISVDHRVPESFGGFWAQFRGRGRAVPYIEHALKKQTLPHMTARRALSLAKSLGTVALVVPFAERAIRLSKHSPQGLRDAPSFWAAQHMLIAAHRLGEWESVRELWRTRKAAA